MNYKQITTEANFLTTIDTSEFLIKSRIRNNSLSDVSIDSLDDKLVKLMFDFCMKNYFLDWIVK